MTTDVKFREMAYSMPPQQLNILKSAARSGDETNAMVMCRLYYPSMSGVEAEKFMDWLKKENA